jgi:23S rRNA (cytidine1920-2'-O)/16S rRNA (cytidine1409-2'-O)-methyltransferase
LSAPGKRERLDILMTARGLVKSRSRARDLIRRGEVRVDGAVVTRPSAPTDAAAVIEIPHGAADYVSRGALKLETALDHFRFPVEGCNALDIGASTGGFTQVLLERGAARVRAVDVGHGQLDEALAADPRVTSMEGTDARALSADMLPEPVTAIVADLSFISLLKVLPHLLPLVAPGCWLVALIKPQFEAGPGQVGKGGIVRDEQARAEAVANVGGWLADQSGWEVTGIIDSPVAGGSGNSEYLIGARRDP